MAVLDRPLPGRAHLAPGDEVPEISYEAGGAYATLEGRGEIRASVDGTAGESIAVDGAGLYELTSHPRHEPHRLRLDVIAGTLSVWSLSFAAGVP